MHEGESRWWYQTHSLTHTHTHAHTHAHIHPLPQRLQDQEQATEGPLHEETSSQCANTAASTRATASTNARGKPGSRARVAARELKGLEFENPGPRSSCPHDVRTPIKSCCLCCWFIAVLPTSLQLHHPCTTSSCPAPFVLLRCLVACCCRVPMQESWTCAQCSSANIGGLVCSVCQHRRPRSARHAAIPLDRKAPASTRRRSSARSARSDSARQRASPAPQTSAPQPDARVSSSNTSSNTSSKGGRRKGISADTSADTNSDTSDGVAAAAKHGPAKHGPAKRRGQKIGSCLACRRTYTYVHTHLRTSKRCAQEMEERHHKYRKQQQRARAAESSAIRQCLLCRTAFSSVWELQVHLRGPDHLRRAAVLLARGTDASNMYGAPERRPIQPTISEAFNAAIEFGKTAGDAWDAFAHRRNGADGESSMSATTPFAAGASSSSASGASAEDTHLRAGGVGAHGGLPTADEFEALLEHENAKEEEEEKAAAAAAAAAVKLSKNKGGAAGRVQAARQGTRTEECRGGEKRAKRGVGRTTGQREEERKKHKEEHREAEEREAEEREEHRADEREERKRGSSECEPQQQQQQQQQQLGNGNALATAGAKVRFVCEAIAASFFADGTPRDEASTPAASASSERPTVAPTPTAAQHVLQAQDMRPTEAHAVMSVLAQQVNQQRAALIASLEAKFPF